MVYICCNLFNHSPFRRYSLHSVFVHYKYYSSVSLCIFIYSGFDFSTIAFQAACFYKWNFFRTQPHIFMYALSGFFHVAVAGLSICDRDPQRQKDLPPCRWRESLQPLIYSYQLYIWGLNPGLTVIFSVYIIWHILKCLLSVKHQEIGRQIEVIPVTRAVSLVGIIGTQTLKLKVRKTWEDVSSLA